LLSPLNKKQKNLYKTRNNFLLLGDGSHCPILNLHKRLQTHHYKYLIYLKENTFFLRLLSKEDVFVSRQARKQNRLNGYDYSQTNHYFVTIRSNNRKKWFGEIKNNEMILNDGGNMIDL